MANEVEPILIDALYDELQAEHFVTISTIDYETKGPNVSAISWIYAPTNQIIRFAVDFKSRIVTNIEHNSLVAINMIANESCYSISGSASIYQKKLENVPLKLVLVEVKITEVRDVMFYGSKISINPSYEKTYDPVAAAKLDKQVIEAIKQAQ
ncbi:hypothetical protein FZC66_12245 [Priestia megaterium]|nr:hypothetical protein FZC66_12245 [Priestia megaterium]